MNTYCAKCRKDTENLDPEMVKKKMVDYLCSQNVLSVELKSQDL